MSLLAKRFVIVGLNRKTHGQSVGFVRGDIFSQLNNLRNTIFCHERGVRALYAVLPGFYGERIGVGKGRFGTKAESTNKVVGLRFGGFEVRRVQLHDLLVRQSGAEVLDVKLIIQAIGKFDFKRRFLIPIQYMRVRSIRGQLAHNGHGFVRIQTGGENLKGLGRLFDSERTLGATPGDFNDTGIGLKLHAYILAGVPPHKCSRCTETLLNVSRRIHSCCASSPYLPIQAP